MSLCCHASISHNQFSVTAPAELHQLTNLQEIRLANNSLTETIHYHIGLLHHLTTFLVDGNDLAGTLPNELMELAEDRVLKTIGCAGKNFTGPLMPSAGLDH